ncbi:MAG: hypothetical protein AAF806_20515 [Bacteroidota bacterium]
MTSYLSFIVTILSTCILLFSCQKESSKPVNSLKSINTLIYTLTPENGGEEVVLSFQDLDGEGGNVPNIKTDALMSNTIYKGEIELWNFPNDGTGLDNRLIKSISAEVKESAANHQFFFSSGINGLNFDYEDEDVNGDPLGLFTQIATGKIDTGTINIVLRYLPNKSARGVANGDITNAGGATDIEVSFEVEVR